MQVVTPSTKTYASEHALNFDARVEDGFTDSGRDVPPRSAADSAADPPDLGGREVLVVDLEALRADWIPQAARWVIHAAVFCWCHAQ